MADHIHPEMDQTHASKGKVPSRALIYFVLLTFAITWGIVVGTYSSIYIAKNVVLMLGVKRDWSKEKKPTGNQFMDIDA